MARKPVSPPVPVKLVRVINLERHRLDVLLVNGNAVSLPPKQKGAVWPEINAVLVSPSMKRLAAEGHIRIEEV